jgi:RNA polymerase sigma-70 factor (ECF subfamily)
VKTDARLAVEAREGSEDAFRELVSRYERPLYAFIVRMVRDPTVAEDLAQEALIKVYRALGSYDPERKFSSWLFKIAHNATIDAVRRREPVAESLDAGDAADDGPPRQYADPRAISPEKARETSELGRALDRALGELRPEYREVMLLRFREGLPYEEIAEITGMPLGTVKTFLHRARGRMESLLTAAGWGPSMPAPAETSRRRAP